MVHDAAEGLHAHRRMERHRARSLAPHDLHFESRDYIKDVRAAVERAHDESHSSQINRRLTPGLLGFPDGGNDEPANDQGNQGNQGNDGGNDGDDTPTTTRGGANGNTRPATTSAASRTTTSSSDRGLLDTLLDPVTRSHSTTSSSSSSSTPTTSSTRTTSSSSRTTSSSTVRHTTSSTEPLPTLTTPTPSTATAVAYVTSSLNTVTPTATPEPESDGPGAGPIIGIVAGALAGVALLAAIIGFIVKRVRSKEDPYESNPFDRDDFRRQSAMLPENFDDDDGAPSMSEHQHNNLGAAGYGGAAAAAAGGMAYASASQSSHNASGGPRPPTMFERHMAGPGAQYAFDDAGAPPVPQVGAVFNQGPAPSLPPMAFGGSDPYTLAGVGGRDHEGFNNSVNPYAHLDRNRSLGSDRGYQQSFQPGQLAFAGQDPQSEAQLDRAGSNGSDFSQAQVLDAPSQNGRDLISPFTNPHDNFAHHGVGHQYESEHAYDTAGRPGTAEGRSGTPDLDNPQNHYAPTDAINGGERHYQASPEPSARAASPFNALDSPPQQPLQVRNLMPGQQQQHQRPISTATADPSDAYGGCY